jgi:hypothetical protein
MGLASYKIVHSQDGWSIEHDGKTSGSYATKEAAFEAAVGPASNSIKQGHTVRIAVDGSEGSRPNRCALVSFNDDKRSPPRLKPGGLLGMRARSPLRSHPAPTQALTTDGAKAGGALQ